MTTRAAILNLEGMFRGDVVYPSRTDDHDLSENQVLTWPGLDHLGSEMSLFSSGFRLTGSGGALVKEMDVAHWVRLIQESRNGPSGGHPLSTSPSP